MEKIEAGPGIGKNLISGYGVMPTRLGRLINCQ
jgi:hypothetical protein